MNWDALIRALTVSPENTIVALVAFSSILVVGYTIGNIIGRNHQKEKILDAQIQLRNTEKELKSARSKVERVEIALSRGEEGRGVWDLEHLRTPSWYHRRLNNSPAHILAVANLKGGVGKTTLAANLGVFFARDRGKRVLLVDLDYQGSLTGLVALGADLDADPEPEVHRVIGGGAASGNELHLLTHSLQPLGGLRLLAAGYELTVEEDRQLIANLLAAEERFSVFNLARYLSAPEVKENFDIVILDASPRLSAATLNGLFACTSYIIPVRPSPVSNRSVAYFEKQVVEAIRPINRDAKLLGVALTMTVREGAEGSRDKTFVDEIRQNFAGRTGEYGMLAGAYPDGVPLFDTRIPNLAEIGRGIALVGGDQNSKTLLTSFCQEVEAKLENQ